jgi:hypothetical protein
LQQSPIDPDWVPQVSILRLGITQTRG